MERTKILSFLKALCFMGFVICNGAESLSSEFSSKFRILNFEQIKYDLFMKRFDVSEQSAGEKCITELNAIKIGLERSDQWAFESKLNLVFSLLWYFW